VSCWRIVGVAALVACAVACNTNDNSGPSFAFSRPERLEFVCMAPKLGSTEHVVLPRRCCGTLDPTADPATTSLDAAACTTDPTTEGPTTLGAPLLHALITQSTRGEIAAVDLANEDVLDSDRVVPGFTFLDSGGLPTAVVSPPRLPLSARERGPLWTYVASAESFQVRAIATCRFRTGQLCGPELKAGGELALQQRTRVALPAPPSHMVLGPDEALWIALPERGLLARVQLSPNENEPFALDDKGVPLVPRFYRVPVAGSIELPEPVAEQSEYLAICGLGSEYKPATRTLPLAQRAEASSIVRPTRLHFDETSGLLLVADGVAPVLHVFAPGADGALSSLGALPTGSPVRDFVLTPSVPALAPASPMTPALPDPSAPTRRYLYAIDERTDGLVMVFDFLQGEPGSLPRLTPLLAPVRGQRFADRLDLPAPTATLEVVDTRPRSAYVCGAQTDEELEARRAAIGVATTPELRAELQRIDARLAISEEASELQLRGVFVMAASLAGVISVVDVHDLDLACRARNDCAGIDCADPAVCPPGNLFGSPDSDRQDALAVRRHAIRRSSAGQLEASVVAGNVLTRIDCSEGSVRALPEPDEVGDALVCVPRDPWSTATASWTIQHQGLLPGLATATAVLEPGPSPEQLNVAMPTGLSLCARGAQVGDVVSVVGEPPGHTKCAAPTTSEKVLLEVEQVFDDRLVVRPLLDAEAQTTPAAESARLLGCYPDFAGVEVRSGGYLVTSTSGDYLHRLTKGADGACVELDDATKDARFTSRPVADASGNLRFENLYVSFVIRALDMQSNEPPQARETTIQVRGASTPLNLSNVSADRVTDALPASLRFLPEVGDLFVLDTASQGLRRYTLAPFENDGSIFR